MRVCRRPLGMIGKAMSSAAILRKHAATNTVVNPSQLSLSNDIENVDNLPPAFRALVHEFGWSIVRAFMDCGMTQPHRIRHLIHTVWQGNKEPANKRKSAGPGSRALSSLDDLLIQSGSSVNAQTVIGLLRSADLAAVIRDPTPNMIAASSNALDEANTGRVTHEQKHQLRLRAAIRRGEADLWPFLEDR